MKKTPTAFRYYLTPSVIWAAAGILFVLIAGPSLELQSRGHLAAAGLEELAGLKSGEKFTSLQQAYEEHRVLYFPPGKPDRPGWALEAFNLGGQKVLPQAQEALELIPSEVRSALPRASGWHIRHEDRILKVYFAWSLMGADGTPLGALRLSKPMEEPYGQLWLIYLIILVLLALAGFAATGRRLHRLGKGLGRMTLSAQAFGKGVARPLTYFETPRELKELNTTLNESYRITETLLARERALKADLEAALESMVEGVIVLDPHLEVKRINPAAQRMFGLAGRDWQGATLLELCRSSSLQDLAQQLRREGFLAEGTLHHDQRTLQVNGSSLVISGEVQGLVLVFHDITRMKKLEEVRRDFVANVSHELKTPITNILGYVETLAGDDLEDKETLRRFLQIIEKNSRRLGSIIEDLLVLAKLEQGGSPVQAKEAADLESLFEAAVQTCLPRMRKKETRLVKRLMPAPALVYPTLVEQALVNLLDNAVKYSPPGTEVAVEITPDGGEWILSVEDQGPGIPEKDLPRIFERFYRVDKARSLEMGGTGLGLSIVKHIALVHGGRASVSSQEGQGSRFMLRLPRTP